MGDESDARRATWTGAALVAMALGATYTATLCPTIYSGDAPELAAAASTFGIPHPPGYPLYMLLGNLWVRLLPVGDVAWRLNLLSSLAAVGAALMLLLALIHLGARPLAAVFGALSLGLGATYWSQATIAEVYAVDMFLATLTLLAAARARVGSTARGAALFLLCAGLWVGHRNVNVIYAPTLLVIAWPALRCVPRSWRAVVWSFAALLPSALVFIYLPLASARQPLLDAGDPETWSRFFKLVSGHYYRRYLAGPSTDELLHILGGLPRELGLALLAAPVGILAAWRLDRRVMLAFAYLAVSSLIFAASYRVPDVAVFTLPALLGLAALAAFGAQPLLDVLAKSAPPFVGGFLVAVGAVALGATSFGDNDLRGQTLARDFARDALMEVAPRGVVISHVDTVSFSLWYAQAVERRRRDVLVVSRGRAVDWHQQQARRLRPDLDVPLYEGGDQASRWPALLALRNAGKVGVFVTADLRGTFAPSDALQVEAVLAELPAGLVTRLVPRKEAPSPSVVAAGNEGFWRRAWPHATRARQQKLATEMQALLLHYASKRLIFARYCLWNGLARCAAKAAQAVIDLDTGPVLAAVNAEYGRRGQRYHMSDMPELARGVLDLARALRGERLALTEIRRALGQGGRASRDRAPAMESLLERQNQEGIALAKRGALDAALRRFDAVLQAQPAHVGALFNRAKVLAMLGRSAEATAAYEELLRVSPANMAGLLGLAELKRESDPRAAALLYRRALKSAGPDPLRELARSRLRELGEPPAEGRTQR